MIEFLVGLGLRVDTISPADDPREVVLQSSSGSVRLRRVDGCGSSMVIGSSDDLAAGERLGPDGLIVDVQPATPRLARPDNVPTLTLTGCGDGDAGIGAATNGLAGARVHTAATSTMSTSI